MIVDTFMNGEVCLVLYYDSKNLVLYYDSKKEYLISYLPYSLSKLF